MAYAKSSYTGNGSTTNYTVTFPYISQTHVLVYVNGVLQTLTTNYTWFNATTISFNSAPANGAAILFLRSSNRSARLVDYQDGSTLTEALLDQDANQSFYVAQEAMDTADSAISIGVDNTINAQNKRISNLADPVNAQDAATKSYGDANWGATAAASAAASASSASGSASSASASALAAATSASNAATSETNAATSASNAAATLSNARQKGKETIWVPATAMVARTTAGAAPGTVESTTNKIMVKTLDFDQTTPEYAQFSVRMPKSWNEGTVTATFLWSSNIAGTNAVQWGITAVALSDGDAIDVAFGTAQTVYDSQLGQAWLHQSTETGALTIAGTPAAGDVVIFQVFRNAADGGDTLAGDARLHGVTLFYTTDAANDA